MKRYTKENQVVIAGYVGNVERKSETLVSVSIANRINANETEWVHVAFTNSTGEYQTPAFADLATKISVGQYITVVANEREYGEYKNYYCVAFEYGPRKKEG